MAGTPETVAVARAASQRAYAARAAQDPDRLRRALNIIRAALDAGLITRDQI